jgi:hypothetical protein
MAVRRIGGVLTRDAHWAGLRMFAAHQRERGEHLLPADWFVSDGPERSRFIIQGDKPAC